MKEFAELLAAVGQLLWPVGIVGIVWLFRAEIRRVLSRDGEIGVKILGNELVIKPTKAERRPEQGGGTVLPAVDVGKPLPADYLFLTHTSFLRKEKQAEFQQRCNLPGVPHYDIRVILDSYYEGALDRVKYVVYFLHEAYPEPVQAKSNRSEKFLLKEVANGEYVLLAEVYLNDRRDPILLQRHITLWESGPKL